MSSEYIPVALRQQVFDRAECVNIVAVNTFQVDFTTVAISAIKG
jgi:hypothetical protein